MSRHHHVTAHEVSHVVHDVNELPKDEAERIYGIQIAEDGNVFDPTYNRKFGSVREWAEFSFQQDELEYSEDFGHGKQTHDDYY